MRHTQVTLHLVNMASQVHSLAAKEFFAASTAGAEDQSKLRDGRSRIGRQATNRCDRDAGRAGTYPLRCSHFMHSAPGMKGSITVQ